MCPELKVAWPNKQASFLLLQGKRIMPEVTNENDKYCSMTNSILAIIRFFHAYFQWLDDMTKNAQLRKQDN